MVVIRDQGSPCDIFPSRNLTRSNLLEGLLLEEEDEETPFVFGFLSAKS